MRAFKDIYFKYVTLSLMVTMILAVLAGYFKWNPLIVIPVIVVWVAGNSFFWKSQAEGRIKKTQEQKNNCEVEEFVSAYENMYRNSPDLEFGDAASKNEVKLNLAYGYYALGELDKMEHILKTTTMSDKTGQKHLVHQVDYHNDWALYYLEKGLLDDCKGELDECNAVLENPKFKEPELSEGRSKYLDTLHYYNMKCGKYDGADQFYKKRLMEDSSVLNKVIASYRLGQIYWHYNMIEEAKKHFDFASKYGGDTIFGYEAEKMMKKRGKNSQ